MGDNDSSEQKILHDLGLSFGREPDYSKTVNVGGYSLANLRSFCNITIQVADDPDKESGVDGSLESG